VDSNDKDSVIKKLNDTLPEAKEIFVYGAGGYGTAAIRRLGIKGIVPTAVLVTSICRNPEEIYGVPVKSVYDYVGDRNEAVVLVATKEIYKENILSLLANQGFTKVISLPEPLTREWELDDGRYNSDGNAFFLRMDRYTKPYLKILRELLDRERRKVLDEGAGMVSRPDSLCLARLVVVLGTKCSLRCKECNNLIPHFQPQKDLPVQKVIEPLRALLAQADSILRCELIGGEPFLYRDLVQVLDYVLAEPKIRQIELTTNATILPNEEVMSRLRNPRVLVRVSDYGDLVDKERFLAHLRRYGISYEVLDLGAWLSSGGVEKRYRSMPVLREQYMKCGPGYTCKALYDGKFFACARAASLWALGYMKEQEYVDFRQEFTKQDIIQFITQDFSWACDYCDQCTPMQRKVPPAEQLPK